MTEIKQDTEVKSIVINENFKENLVDVTKSLIDIPRKSSIIQSQGTSKLSDISHNDEA